MAKFEQMITQDEYDACIKGCQTASCRNKDYFHFVGRNVKEVGRNVGAESRQARDRLLQERCAGQMSGQSIGGGRRDADGTHGAAFRYSKERQLIFNEAQFKE